MRQTLLRALAAGLVWAAFWFVVDSVEAAYGLKRAVGIIKGDEETVALVRAAVGDYVLRVAAAHAVLGLLGAGWLAGWVGLWQRGQPASRRTWFATAGVFASLTSLGLMVWQTTLYPRLHSWNPILQPMVDTLTVPRLQALTAVGAVVLVGLVLRRNRDRPRNLALHAGWLLLWTSGWHLATRLPEPRPAVGNQGPNLVFIGIDALRPDHLGSNGYFRDTAPNIDAFLAQAVVYDQAWTPLARTYPAWTALLSGSLPITVGIRDNLPTPEELVPPQHALLPQVLQDQGVHTRFVTDDSRFSYMVDEGGWDRIHQPVVGLQNFAVSMREPRYRHFHALMHNRLGFALVPTQAFNQAFGNSYRPLLFQDHAVDALAQASQQDRFFYAVHSCVLHAPGDRPWPWHSMYGQAGVTSSNRFKYDRSGTRLVHADGDDQEPVDVVAEQNVRIYDSGIDMADRLVGALMAELETTGLLDNTVVVLFSDHGENHWAPDLPYAFKGPNHGFHPYGDGQFRTVLAIRYPDTAPRRDERTVRLIDIAPTMAREFGLEWPNPIDGVDLQALDDETWPRLVYIETGLSESTYWNEGHLDYPFTHISQRYRLDAALDRVFIRPRFRKALVRAKDRVVQSGRWKLVYRPTEDGQLLQLFDREADVHNRHDLSGQHPDVLEQLSNELERMLALDGLALR